MTASDDAPEDCGDRAAYRVTYDAYQPELAKFVNYRVGDPEAAKEICQETWIGYFRRFAEYQTRDNPKLPLFAIANNKVADWWRRQPPRAADPTPPGSVSASERLEEIGRGILADTDVDLGNRVAFEVDLARAVAQLPPRAQQAAELYFVRDLDQAAVAMLMGVTVDAVKKLIGRARQMLIQSPHLTGYNQLPVTRREVRK